MLTAVGVASVLIGAIGKAWIAPIDAELQFAKENVHRLDTELTQKNSEIHELQSQVFAQREAVIALEKEIETQIRWSTDATNTRARAAEQMLAVIWEKAFGTALPIPPYISAGPGSAKP